MKFFSLNDVKAASNHYFDKGNKKAFGDISYKVERFGTKHYLITHTRAWGKQDFWHAKEIDAETGKIGSDMIGGKREFETWAQLRRHLIELNQTRVIFRKYPDGQIIALFPDDKENDGCIDSYMHIGQHGAANYDGVMAETKPAKKSEYSDLKSELEYNPFYYLLLLKVVKEK